MTKYYFLRKNQLVHCRETGKKGNFTRVWFRPKICGDGWQSYESHSTIVIDQLEKELKEGKLTPIPEKLIDKNKEAWKDEKEEKVVD